nr:hypothetical protein K-LCC10_0243 [Kaumoebavirus]
MNPSLITILEKVADNISIVGFRPNKYFNVFKVVDYLEWVITTSEKKLEEEITWIIYRLIELRKMSPVVANFSRISLLGRCPEYYDTIDEAIEMISGYFDPADALKLEKIKAKMHVIFFLYGKLYKFHTTVPEEFHQHIEAFHDSLKYRRMRLAARMRELILLPKYKAE